MQVFRTIGAADFIVVVGADSVDIFAPDNAGGFAAHSPTRDKLEAFVHRDGELVRQYISGGRVAEASYKLEKLSEEAADEIRQRCYIIADVIGVHHETANTVPPTHPEILAIPAAQRGGTPFYEIRSDKHLPKKIAQIKRYLWA